MFCTKKYYILCYKMWNLEFKGAMKLYFMYYSCVVIILSSKDLCKFTFSTCSLFWIRCHLKRVPSKDLKTFDYSFKCSFSFFFFFFLSLYKNNLWKHKNQLFKTCFQKHVSREIFILVLSFIQSFTYKEKCATVTKAELVTKI